MHDLNELLELSKSIATQGGQKLSNNYLPSHKEYIHCAELPKEIKAGADGFVERYILQELAATGFPVLSEESGYIQGQPESQYMFIIDPLDGTFNFVKGLGPCAVSIALWHNNKPIFGVIYHLVEKKLYWGGEGIGAYCDDKSISVSNTSKIEKASICTGFPVRLNTENNDVMQKFWNLISPYAKVRMLGTAAISLINVAKGSADVYSEQSIMLWDVAAGLAIVEGSGGCLYYENGPHKYSLNVFASNEPLFKYHNK